MLFNADTARAKIADYVWTYNPCAPVERRSYWHHFLQIMALVGRDLISGPLNLRSMSLAYTTLLAFIPLLAVSMWFLRWIGVHEQMEPALASLLAPLGDQSAEFSSKIVEFVENMKIGLLGLLGVSMLIYAAVSLMRKIESAFNHTWQLKSRRSWIQRISIYLVLLAAGPTLFFSALTVTASLAAHSIPAAIIDFPLLGELIDVFGKFLPYMLVISAFTLTYFTVPDTTVRFGSAFYGGLLAGILWQSTGILFAVFVAGSTNYTVIYSGFAIVMLFIVWVQLSWLILLIGASISYYHQHPEVLKWSNLNVHLTGRMREQLALQLMLNIARSLEQQSTMQCTIEKLAKYQQVPMDILRRLLNALEAGDLVYRTGDDPPRYLLSRSIDRIRLIDILRGLRSAQVTAPGVSFFCDSSISKLQSDIESSYESVLGERTLADLVAQATGGNNENSLV